MTNLAIHKNATFQDAIAGYMLYLTDACNSTIHVRQLYQVIGSQRYIDAPSLARTLNQKDQVNPRAPFHAPCNCQVYRSRQVGTYKRTMHGITTCEAFIFIMPFYLFIYTVILIFKCIPLYFLSCGACT